MVYLLHFNLESVRELTDAELVALGAVMAEAVAESPFAGVSAELVDAEGL